jgi:DNA-binding transcriptional MerR regulator
MAKRIIRFPVAGISQLLDTVNERYDKLSALQQIFNEKKSELRENLRRLEGFDMAKALKEISSRMNRLLKYQEPLEAPIGDVKQYRRIQNKAAASAQRVIDALDDLTEQVDELLRLNRAP